MRKLLASRFVVIPLAIVAICSLLVGDGTASIFAGSAALLCWAWGGFPSLLPPPRRRVRSEGGPSEVKVSVRRPGGTRERDLSGTFKRLDPHWQSWLANSGTAPGDGD